MELTRRQFIISASTAAAAAALPAIYIGANNKIQKRIDLFQDFTSKQIEHLDKYVMSSFLPSLISCLYLAYALEQYYLVFSLIIIMLSIIVLI